MSADQSITDTKAAGWLRPRDTILATLPCRVRQPGTPFVKSDVILVSHDTAGNEEAGLFICSASSDKASPPHVQHTLAINASFSHSLLQTPPSPSTSFFHQSSRPHITLDLKYGEERYELRIAAHHTVLVQTLTKELRRLSEVVSHSTTPRCLQYHWLAYYPIDPAPIEDTPSTSTSLSETGSRDASGLPSAASTLATPMSSLSVDQPTCGPSGSEDEQEDRHPSPYAPGFSRRGFLRTRLFERQSQWSSNQTIKIRCATYNVNDRLPPKGTTELSSLVGDGTEDLLVFGFQEVDVRSQALLFAQGNDRAVAWEEALFRGLGDKANEFEKLAFSQYVGVMTIVLVRKTLRPAITRVETSERGIGLLGFAGNKAGVAVRLKVHDTTLAFVNCHLAAFSAALDRRRLDYSTLLKSLTFPRPLESEVTNLVYEEFLPDQPDESLSLNDSNALFWLGDLNYRIDLDDDKLAALVKWKRWTDVLEKDQLRSDVKDGKSFVGFKEASIDFPPSFKYVHGSTTLDTRRPAAYTDRVLYKVPQLVPDTETAATNETIKIGTYTSHEILWSDHRPVSCTFEVTVRFPDEEKRKADLGIVRSELDRLDEEWAPAIEVEDNELEFGDVRHGCPAVKTVSLRNNGRVPASFNFKAPTGKDICKPIYWPYPAIGVIEPGSTMEMRITLNVDAVWSSRLTIGEEDTNDVLVLQVVNGKDTFITLHANYLPSIIGLPLAQLNKLPDGIRQLSLAQRKRLNDSISLLTPKEEASDPYEARRPSKAIKPAQVIWRLLESLMEKHDGILWTDISEKGRILAVLEALDCDQSLPTCDPSVISHTLVYILAALPEPLIPSYLQSKCLEAEDRDEGYAILEGVEGVHTNILIGLMSVVRLCTPDAASDNPTIVSLVPAVFGPQRDTERSEAEYERQGRIRFVKILLEG